MKFGIALGRCSPRAWNDVVDAAEQLGYESVWMPEHLVFPTTMSSSPTPGDEHPPVSPTTPVYDVFAYLSYVAARTTRLRLGTHVYNLGLRHPFVAARAVQTLDVVSGGRVELGIGAGWLAQEWAAAQLDFSTRGRRLDEALEVCTRLWSEEIVEHHGEFFDFAPVMFEPKPIQEPWPPVLVGGESDAALRRAARAGDGWIGMDHDRGSAERSIARVRSLLDESGRSSEGFQICLGGVVGGPDDAQAWEEIGVTRMIVSPWSRSREAVKGMERFAALVGLGGLDQPA